MASSKNYRFEEIALRDLRIDPKVQRDLEEPHVKRLAANWNPQFIGCLVGSRRSDGYVYLTDGQQRRAAGLIVDRDMKMPVMVFDDWTFTTEGESFLAFNKDSKTVSTYDRYKVAVAIGHGPEAEIDQLIRGLNLQVGRHASENTLACPATLVRIAKQKGEWQSVLTTTIQVMLHAAYNLREDNPWDAVFLESMAIFLRVHGSNENFDLDIVKTMLLDDPFFRGPRVLVQEARQNAEGNNRAVGEGARLIQRHYNKRVRSAKKKLKV